MHQKGFTILEILIVVAILAILTSISLAAFVSYRKSQALKADTENVAGLLAQARSQTVSSKNASAYGVHFTSGSATLFTAPTYSAGAASNVVYTLTPGNALTTTLPGGTSALLFNRITGETNQSGTIEVKITSETASSTISIYKTGTIEKR